ncbi:MAG: hypothetical protein HYV34_00090 [Candidatus Kerfeldbacteria bacterium]|nr:hypothetical protein [Candidatus Kerfeldbacteria bacterium]
MMRSTLAIALVTAVCAACSARAPTKSYEEPPLTKKAVGEEITAEVVEDEVLGDRILGELLANSPILLFGELSQRLNPLRGMGKLVVLASPTHTQWVMRPLASTGWVYPARVEYGALHIRSFVEWVLVTQETSLLIPATMIATDTAGELPATVRARVPSQGETEGETVHVHMFVIE